MSKSLQDQLLGAGLVDNKKAKAIKKEQRKNKKQQPKGQQQEDEAKILAKQALDAKTERSRELNQKRNDEAEQKAVLAQIKQLIANGQIAYKSGDVAYQFNDAGKIKKLYVTPPLQEQLAKGIIAIAKHGEGYALVPKVVAEKIASRCEDFIVLLNKKGQALTDEDDPYAAYEIPDDLMW